MAMVRPVSSRARTRQFAMLEVAIVFAIGGSLVAVAVPAFLREVHASRLVEPVEGLERLGASAVAYARDQAPAAASSGAPAGPVFPTSAPMTPSLPPRGHCEVDAPNAWDAPTWVALGFRPAPAGTPHCFAFAFDSASSPTRSTFRAHAHGDLDGDGIPSTFEVTGRSIEGDPRGPMLDPGMFVDSEVE